MLNSRFREIAPGQTVELIATRIQFDYVPDGLSTPESLTAVWLSQEFLAIGDGYQRIGDRGERMTTVLANHASKVLTITDPVTEQEVSLSAAGAVVWMQAWFDYQHNREHPAPAPIEE